MLLVPGKRLFFYILPHKKIQLLDKAKMAVVTKLDPKVLITQMVPPGCNCVKDGRGRPPSSLQRLHSSQNRGWRVREIRGRAREVALAEAVAGCPQANHRGGGGGGEPVGRPADRDRPR